MADQAIVYDDAVKYWSSVSADDNGVLGGFGPQTIVPKADIVGSLAFVKRLGSLSANTFPNGPFGGEKVILDVGAGVGRVSRDVLSKFSDAVDLLEPAEPLLQAAKQIQSIVRVNNFFQLGLQDFEFTSGYKYWAVWCQWCLGQVPDDVLVDFMRRAVENLQPGGIIVVKENMSTSGEDIFDETDSSVTRTHEKFKLLFAKAGLRVLLTSVQKGFPEELFPIRMYALAPPLQQDPQI